MAEVIPPRTKTEHGVLYSIKQDGRNVQARKALHHEIVRLRALILSLKRGSCWCEMGIGNPMMRGAHTEACRQAQTLEDDTF